MTDPQQTAQASGNSQGLTIPDDVKTKYPELIELVLGSESMNNEERQYWINILPIMTPDQVQNLKDILMNEKRQLAAIDQKYAKEIEQIGQAQLIKHTEEERRKKREERRQAEQMQSQTEESAEEDILQQIQNL